MTERQAELLDKYDKLPKGENLCTTRIKAKNFQTVSTIRIKR